MSKSRTEQITERQSGIPKSYLKTYNKAVKGKSLRASINAQCQECCGYQVKEIRHCTDLACPLYAVRPYRSSQSARNEGFNGVESPKSGQGE